MPIFNNREQDVILSNKYRFPIVNSIKSRKSVIFIDLLKDCHYNIVHIVLKLSQENFMSKLIVWLSRINSAHIALAASIVALIAFDGPPGA